VLKALKMAGIQGSLVRYKDFEPDKYDAVILPGGFSFGDYLRAGAVASRTAMVEHLRTMASEGKPVIGICNGFQILVEAGLLRGALLPNLNMRFVSKWIHLRVLRRGTVLTKALRKEVLRLPIAHAEGRYYSDNLEEAKRLAFLAYCDERGRIEESSNPNGSILNIAGMANEEGNVVGLMPHPERASFPHVVPFGEPDGLMMLRGLLY
jgi:phosphoribosylformylglycinamidine synthase I